MVRIEPLNHRDIAVAQQIHAVLMLAYAQEAQLLRVKHFAPLERTPADVQADNEHYLGALRGEAIVGIVSFAPDEEPGQFLISSLVVHPGHQRQGIATALMREALRLGDGEAFAVSTGANNSPAIALYRGLGFIEYRFGTIGPESLPLVKLRRRVRP